MTTSTLTRADLVDTLVREVDIPRYQAVSFLEATLETLISSIVSNEHFKVSSFGSFNVRQKRKRMGRNPKTGIEAVISPRRVLTFKASLYLREKVLRGKG